jgi:hypothetical protein
VKYLAVAWPQGLEDLDFISLPLKWFCRTTGTPASHKGPRFKPGLSGKPFSQYHLQLPKE